MKGGRRETHLLLLHFPRKYGPAHAFGTGAALVSVVTMQTETNT